MIFLFLMSYISFIMRKTPLILLLFICLNSFLTLAQSPWQKIKKEKTSTVNSKSSNTSSETALLYALDIILFKQEIAALNSKTAKKSSVEISIPNTNGELEKFSISESSNFEPELQAKYPDIRAYEGKGITDKRARLNFSLSPKGIQTIILRSDSASEFIEPYTEDTSLYIIKSSNKRDKGSLPLNCKTEDVSLNKELINKTAKITANNNVFKTLRLALSCTGEYASYHGGTVAGALAGMNATMTRVNAIFNRDLAIKLNMINNNELIIYTNATTDPYSNTSNINNWSQELQSTLTTVITNSGYDIGHLFGASGGGGDAGCIGCVCENPTSEEPLAKGSAYTSPADNKPEGDTFDIDFVAHEMGHQLGGNHTFSYSLEGQGVSVEPGSGSTIMAYAGITDGYNVQERSDDYFAYASILQIQNNLNTKSCPTSTLITTNNTPVINAGADYTIPKGTAFILKGTGSDADGNSLTYCWEQNDSATSANNENSFAISTKTNGPLFRSLSPTSSPDRYMPNLTNVLSGKLTSSWESVSNVERSLHFVLTGRDNAAMGTAQTNSDEMTITVSGSIGPFTITSQNTEEINWKQGTTETITWNVNNSNTLTGASNVNIKLSYDNGLTFPKTLALNTPNDGSEVITVPNATEKNCRIMIEPVGNIFYAVNSKTFAIGYTTNSSCNTNTFTAPFAIPEREAYTTRTINYPSTTGEISDVNFNVKITHAYLSDVEMEIISPQGTTVKLLERTCADSNTTLELNFDDSGSEINCSSTSTQTVIPTGLLSTFNGENPSGTWTFRIRDQFEEDNGTLDAASINICEKSYILTKPEFRIFDFVTYTNPNNGTFKVKFTSDSTNNVQLKIYDILGKLVVQKEYPRTILFEELIEIPNAQSGIYMLEAIVGEKKVITKVLVN